MVSLFSEANLNYLEISSGALHVCSYTGSSNLKVYPVESIQSVVAMVPFTCGSARAENTARKAAEGSAVVYKPGELFFLAEKLGLETLHMAGGDEVEEPDEYESE